MAIAIRQRTGVDEPAGATRSVFRSLADATRRLAQKVTHKFGELVGTRKGADELPLAVHRPSER